jgi:hypothetical protein
LSASKKPSCPIVPKSANREITNQIRMIRRKSPFFEVPTSHFGSTAGSLISVREAGVFGRVDSFEGVLAMEQRAQNLQSVLLFSITVITATTALLVGAELYLMLH